MDHQLTAIMSTTTVLIAAIGFVLKRIDASSARILDRLDSLCCALSKHIAEDASMHGAITERGTDMLRRLDQLEKDR